MDSYVGGNIGVKTIDELKAIFETLAASSQQKSSMPRKVKASAVVMSPDMKKQRVDMLRDLQDLKMKQNSPKLEEKEPKLCDVCRVLGHGAEACPNMGAMTCEGRA